jgi:hypothetical protein
MGWSFNKVESDRPLAVRTGNTVPTRPLKRSALAQLRPGANAPRASVRLLEALWRRRVGPGNFTPSPSQIPDLILSHHPRCPPRGLRLQPARATAVSGFDGVGGDQVSAHTGRLAGDPSRAEAAGRFCAGERRHSVILVVGSQ